MGVSSEWVCVAGVGGCTQYCFPMLQEAVIVSVFAVVVGRNPAV